MHGTQLRSRTRISSHLTPAADAQDPGTIDADRPLSLAPLVYARVKAYSSLYERQVQKTGLAQNSGTTYIARDMLEIVNKGDSASPDLKLWGFSDANAS
ncbi:hypothetical protein VDGD_03898 [Verticillium dahliae]|nr:hypothetical protein VDGD_03898 [Verticillium dahliae]